MRHWGLVALILAVIAAAATYEITKRLVHPLYTSQVTLEVQLGNSTQTPYADPAINSEFASTEAAAANQPDYVHRATQAAARSLPPSTPLHVNSVTCTPQGTTALFSCSVTASNPQSAAAVANSLASVFMQGETSWQGSRFQALLQRIKTEEGQAKNRGDSVRYNDLVQLETSLRVTGALPVMRVVTPAAIPRSPSSPHPPLNAALAFFLVFALVMAGGIVADRLDDSIQDEEELRRLTNLPVLSVVPTDGSLRGAAPGHDSLVLVTHPRSAASEAFRIARAGIGFSNVDAPPRTVLVTSAAPGEGKSTVSANLAVAYAEAGQSVILVDLDLWQQTISRIFGTSGSGITNLLVDGSGQPGNYLHSSGVPDVQILPSGVRPPNPAGLLSSGRMAEVIAQLRSMADVVIIDSPALLAVVDARIVAALCDTIVFVARPERIKRRALREAMETLRSLHTDVSGMIVNSFGRANAAPYYREYMKHVTETAATPARPDTQQPAVRPITGREEASG